MRKWICAAVAASVALAGCGSGTGGATGQGTGGSGATGAGGGSDAGIGSGPVTGLPDAGWSTTADAQPFEPVSPPDAAAKPQDDAGGYPVCDAGSLPADTFITQVLSFEAGACAGFGQSEMPEIIEGPPVGQGASNGSLDVLSLGNGGSIVVGFAPNSIVDGPGVDFVVFENAFDIGGSASRLYAEPGEVSVSSDGVTWTAFPCTATTYPYGECAGWRPVSSNPDDCISPLDTTNAGGDPFDLHDIGVTSARYVRIVDQIAEACPTNPADAPNTNGFDLDAIAIVNGSATN